MTIESNWDWEDDAPRGVFAAVVAAAERASMGDAEGASVAIASSTAEPRWLAICAVRALAGLLAGPGAGQDFDKLRTDAHAIAAATRAPDSQVRLCLEAIALAEAYERGAHGRLDELTAILEFTPADIACAAATLAGHVVAYLAGDDAPLLFAAWKLKHGDGGA